MTIAVRPRIICSMACWIISSVSESTDEVASSNTRIFGSYTMALMKEIGANDIQVLRGVEDDKAYHAGMNNTVTAHDLMLVFKTLGERKAISAEASSMMIDILTAQEFNDGIPGGLPKGTPVAHKTGSITAIAHDAGLVDSKYVLVVLTKGFKKTDDAEKVIAEISKLIWESRKSS